MQNNPYQTPRIARDSAPPLRVSTTTLTISAILAVAVGCSIGYFAGYTHGYADCTAVFGGP
jgi:ABC-type dipeptide/oligopeptide/nickel transport system permease subunit